MSLSDHQRLRERDVLYRVDFYLCEPAPTCRQYEMQNINNEDGETENDKRT